MLETIIKTLIFIAAAFGAIVYYRKTKGSKYNVIRVLIAVALLVMLLSFLIPGSIVDYSYGTIKDDVVVPMNIAGLFSGFQTAINISITTILFIGVIALFYTILKKSGKYEAVVDDTAYAFRNNKALFIILTILILGLVSVFTGEVFVMVAFVPFLISVIRRLGYSKEVSILSTVGAILLGQAGTLYANYMNTSLTLKFSDNVLTKVIISAVVLIFLMAFVLLFNKKPKLEKKLVKSEETKKLPIFITFGVVFLILLLGFIPWGEYFGFKGFEEFLTNIRKTEFMGVSVFDALIGNSTTVAAFGTWQLINVGVLFIFVDLILAIIYKVFSVDTLVEAAKKALPYIAITILANLIIVLMMNSGIFYTLTMGLTKIAINIFTVGTTTILSALSITEYTYAANFSLVAISSSAKFSQSPENMNLISVVFQSLYYVFLLVSPVSLLIMFGLHLNDIKFKDWIKYIYKFFLVLFITVLIITNIMLNGFDTMSAIAITLLVVGLAFLIYVYKVKSTTVISFNQVNKLEESETKEEVKEVETKIEPVKKTTKKATTKKTTKK